MTHATTTFLHFYISTMVLTGKARKLRTSIKTLITRPKIYQNRREHYANQKVIPSSLLHISTDQMMDILESTFKGKVTIGDELVHQFDEGSDKVVASIKKMNSLFPSVMEYYFGGRLGSSRKTKHVKVRRANKSAPARRSAARPWVARRYKSYRSQ